MASHLREVPITPAKLAIYVCVSVGYCGDAEEICILSMLHTSSVGYRRRYGGKGMQMRTRRTKTVLIGGSLKGKGNRKHCGMSGKALHPDHEDFFTALGRRARELRKAKGWTFQDMVLLHGYHVSQWQKIEKGCPVTVDSLLRMGTVFGLTLAQLLGDLVDYPRPEALNGPVPAKTPRVRAKGTERRSTPVPAKKVRQTTSK